MASDKRLSGRSCAVCKKNRRNFKGSFYSFPKEKYLFDAWVSRCKLSDKILKRNSLLLCEEHFEKKPARRGKIQKGSMPTLKLPPDIKVGKVEDLQQVQTFENNSEENNSSEHKISRNSHQLPFKILSEIIEKKVGEIQQMQTDEHKSKEKSSFEHSEQNSENGRSIEYERNSKNEQNSKDKKRQNLKNKKLIPKNKQKGQKLKNIKQIKKNEFLKSKDLKGKSVVYLEENDCENILCSKYKEKSEYFYKKYFIADSISKIMKRKNAKLKKEEILLRLLNKILQNKLQELVDSSNPRINS